MTATIGEARRDELAGRLAGAVLATLDLQAVYVGDRLGLYRALEDGGPATAPELAARSGIHPRYAREWLEHQAVGAILDVDDVQAAPDERRYTLPAAHAMVLTDPESPWLLAPLSRFVVGTAATMPRLLDAYRTGEGVDWADYGADVVEAQEGINRPQFHHLMGEWIGALPDIAEKLRSGKGRVADVACGTGWSSISIARHFPEVAVDGIDIDAGSIARAKAHAADAGLDGRVSFLFADAASADGEGRYDLVTIFEALHDMSYPVDVLRSLRALLSDGGRVLVGDEKTAARFTLDAGDVERLNYGFSVLHCLPVGMVGENAAGTGTVMREHTVRGYAEQAGFANCEVTPIESDSYRFYLLTP